HHLRIRSTDASDLSSANQAEAAGLDTVDLYIDTTSLLLVGIEVQSHPVDTITKSIPQRFYFSDYREVNGALMPFSVTETLGGQRTWKLELADLQLNPGFADSEFQP